MSSIGLRRGGRETARFHLLPESASDFAGNGAFVDDVLDRDGRARVTAAAERFSREWASLLGLDRLRIAGIPLPSFVHLQLKFRFHFLFRLLEFARAAARENPDAAVLAGLSPAESGTLRHAFGSLGVRVEERSGPGRGGIRGTTFRLDARLRRIREVTLPRYGRYLGRGVRLERTAAPKEDPRILVLDTYCMTPEALRHLKDRGTLLRIPENDRGMKKILLQAGIPFRTVGFRGLPPADWPPATLPFDPRGTGSFVYEGFPFFPLIEPDLRNAVGTIGPRLFSYTTLPEEGLRRIVTREQNFPDGKMLVWLARQAGIRTIMLQHGLMVGEYGYLPMDADIFVAWGEEGRGWMEKRGVPRDRIEVIGFPRFDAVRNDTETRGRRPFGKRLLVVFETTEYNGEDSPLDNYRLLHLVLEAVSPLPDWSVAVRFHPGQPAGEREAFRRFARSCGARVRISRELALGRALESADVVVTEASTVGVEALLSGKIVLVVRSRGYANNPYMETDALPVAASPEDIRARLLRWERFPEERRAATDGAARFVDAYLRREDVPASVRFWEYCLS